MEVFSTYVTIARPMGDDPGTIEPGYYTVADGVVTLTDHEGKPITAGRMQLDYTSNVGDKETEMQVAQRLIWRRYRATKGGTNFNRPLNYPKTGIA
jgi:hypothetical protein